jgi:hypothetical protein
MKTGDPDAAPTPNPTPPRRKPSILHTPAPAPSPLHTPAPAHSPLNAVDKNNTHSMENLHPLNGRNIPSRPNTMKRRASAVDPRSM